jgi:hypothetical protein
MYVIIGSHFVPLDPLNNGVSIVPKLVKLSVNVNSTCCKNIVEAFDNKFLNDGHTVI